jgi:hypothetical protein
MDSTNARTWGARRRRGVCKTHCPTFTSETVPARGARAGTAEPEGDSTERPPPIHSIRAPDTFTSFSMIGPVAS